MRQPAHPRPAPPAGASPWDRALAGRFVRLDGVRGAAILAVMLYHLCRYPLARTPLEQGFTTVVSMGWTGVDLFFVLSGFLITGILLRHRESGRYFRTFYARRAIRILPLYYVVLVLYLYGLPWLTGQGDAFWVPGAERETAWYWLFLSNLWFAFTGSYQHHFLEITWSLAIEEQFYLLWPLVVWGLGRRRLVPVCVGIVVAALVLRVALLLNGPPNPIFIYTFTPCRLDELAAGAFLAAVATDDRAIARVARLARPLAWGCLVAYAVAVAWLRLSLGPAELAGLAPAVAAQKAALAWTGAPLIQSLGFTLLAVGWAALLARVMVAPPGGGVVWLLESRALLTLGKYSYALYLLHVLGGELGRAFFDPDAWRGSFFVAQVGYWAAAIGCSLVLALGTWHALEQPFQRLRRFLPYGDEGAPAPDAGPRRAAGAPGEAGEPAGRGDEAGGTARLQGPEPRGGGLGERRDPS